MTDDRLAVTGLDVDLGGRAVLRDVALTVHGGELVGLVGPNGAGKTTLLRSVIGLTPRRTGTVVVDGRTDRRALDGLGYVPQRHEFAWDFPISVEDAVVAGRVGLMGFLRRPGTKDFAAALRALDRVGMADLRRRPVGELSGGQRQRVLVARALAVEPRVLLLDEPFTGLDMPTQELLTELFLQLAGEGEALLMTTHDLPAAMLTCSRIVLLNRTVVADGPPEALRDPELWMRTFAIGPTNPLLRALGVAA